MKKYTKPELKIVILNNQDVIAASGGIVLANFNSSGKKYSVISY